MAKQALGIGTTADDGTGDSLRDGGDKINDNFDELYDLLGDGTDLSSGISASATVITLSSPVITDPTITGTSTITLDAETDIILDAKGGDIYLKDDGTIFGTFSNNGGNLVIKNSSAEVSAISIAGDEVVTYADDIIIKDAGTIGSSTDPDAMAISSGGVVSFSQSISLVDDKEIVLGTNSDISIKYDETTTDSLVISSDVNDAALGIIFQADDGADAGDEWKLNIANGGTLTLGNDINSAGTHVTLLTVTPNSTAASSTHAFIGKLSASGGLLVADAGTIGSASSTSAITIASTGIVTFVDDIKLKNDGTIGSAGAATAMTIDTNGIVAFVDDIKIKNAGTIGSATTPAAISIASDGLVNLATAAATVNSVVIATVGTQTIWIPAAAMHPTSSNGCAAITDVETTSGRPDLQVLDFDTSADEHAQFQVGFPKSWNAGTITFRVFWTSTATDTDGVAWGLQGVSVANDATIDVAYGTAIVVTDDNISAAEDCLVTATSSAVTIASAADDTMTFFRIFRDVSDGNDDMAEDARLIGVQIFFTTSAATDA